MVRNQVSDTHPSKKPARNSRVEVVSPDDFGPDQFDNPDDSTHTLIEAVEDYILIGLKSSNVTAKVAEHRRILLAMVKYGVEHNWPVVEKISGRHIAHYIEYLKTRKQFPRRSNGSISPGFINKPLSSSYIATIWTRIASMFAWLAKLDNFEYAGVTRHPMKLMSKPRVDLKVVDTVPDEDIKRVLQVTHPRLGKNRLERFTLTRDHAALRLLADTPCRKSGIASMQLDDLDIPGRRVKVFEKFGKERWVLFGNGTARALDRYVTAREKLRPFTIDLWVDKSGNPMSKAWVSLMVKRVADRAEVKGLHTHKFRHTYITKMIEEGISQRVLEHMCGVMRIPQTYLNKIGDQQAEDFYRGRSPADRLDRNR